VLFRSEEARQASQGTAEAAEAASQAFNQAHIQLIHLRNQHENIEREAELKNQQIERFTENRSRLQQELLKVQTDIDELINSNLQDDEQVVRLYAQKKEMEARVGRLEQKVGMTRNSIRQVEEAGAEVRNRREEIKDKQAELKEQATEVRIETNALRERMSVEFQVEVSELSAEALFDKPVEKYDPAEVEEQLLKLRQRVQGYGEINPMAVEAYQEMKERYDFMVGQKNDLLDAKQSLLQTIEEIDQTAKEKFIETFVQVREHFQQVFRSLFSEDDKCDLLLLDEDNPLESDISIIARPKGKRPLTIKQLSGGEKTLTAVALLFSIYLIKPAPFCIFDEVDAPLDDANIDKFNHIIRDFAATSQFIIVTHNKRTMASTSVIYGVTMENLGISRVLAVSLDEIYNDTGAAV
jgi:chromosome segregation protein